MANNVEQVATKGVMGNAVSRLHLIVTKGFFDIMGSIGWDVTVIHQIPISSPSCIITVKTENYSFDIK